jgi:nitroimidazol reductase NimA-like FMN-containing flavoprotein (pyridoxamine 5'-phosphate oxidase superfamily)
MTAKPDTRHRRVAERGGKNFEIACAIIDAARICHAGFALDGQPYVVPMACARHDRQLLLHGSIASRLVKQAGGGLPLCVTITHFDGLVLARSAFHSSMNYRSVMVFGTATVIAKKQAKAAALDALTDQLAPGRRAELRGMTAKELAATSVLALPIETFTTKVRTGPPNDPAYDLDQPVWAGVVPFALTPGAPVSSPNLAAGIAVSACVAKL